MSESVTLPALLNRKDAKAYISALTASDNGSIQPWLRVVYSTDRARIEDMLALVNDGALSTTGERVSPTRREALSAFLAERVAIRERASFLYPQFTKEAALAGAVARMPPQRTVALSLAWESLPVLLNGRVRKQLFFSNQGAARWIQGRVKETGEQVRVLLSGSGGELEITEIVECDSLATALNYALALLLDKKRDIGASLCRCHAPECARFWLLPEKLTGKPTRNFCTDHEGDKKRLSDAERKRRQRKIEEQSGTKSPARAAAKHK
jgi:hypothetical protein